ncbi:isomerizing glutamine--fructose-6-phosphate transaminase, partial [Candidatus Bathyarchaeota archaeon]|nr:isomerizing glutamine--fructose-6-phosphate transaminase [Candidatus Bathyarchaeota archaeon]
MCGIFGCILREGSVAPQILDGLKRLEYRGYDSIGVATIHSGTLEIRKDKGRIDEVSKALKISEMKGSLGIGHTRWATHGAPHMINAHPHTDSKRNIAVIHNGVIENFMELKQELIDKGHDFISKTDTEVIPHLIEEEIQSKKNLKEATLAALKRLVGSYAIAVISSLEPDTIICARHESPLVLGISENSIYCASDVPAIRPYTNKVIYLRNGELSTIKLGSYEIIRISDGSPVERALEEIKWNIEEAEKQDYDHYMSKEIYEQPISLRNGLRLQEQYVDLITHFLDRGKEVLLLGAGTSNHSCIAGSYIFSKLARLTAFPVISSEFIEVYGSSIGIDSVILAVSQSGE